ncbi:Subtilisin inhibitor precursor [Streptomyces sp. YIM 130001]|uniref:subtilase-type protease inhibitor n=1 Tax=Streptomyces sp. YIM 130001 TaxID=2259644 RepID=UPI000ECEBC02|nr:subtilase-type protease inhibitor [Streptomyces sp. YIM 130001]RII20751.1 Subtilisin inhibitor precursor [Streptomyces sp. YIM 130001]
MRPLMRPLVQATGAAAAAASVAVLSAGTAHAEPDTRSTATSLYAPSALVLTIGQGDDPATMISERAVTLTCTPTPGGTHPAATGACAELAGVKGRFTELVGAAPGAWCTKEWRPVVVTADGVWNGRHVRWSASFANPCEMKAGLGEGTALTF